MKRNNLIKYGLTALAASTTLIGAAGTAWAADKKPNIVVIMGDDIGLWNISTYNQGIGAVTSPVCSTPNSTQAPAPSKCALPREHAV